MDASERKAWGPVILLARTELGLTQQEVADRAGVTLPTIRGMEKGTQAPQPEKLRRVLLALGLIDDLSNPDVTYFLAQLRPMLGKLDKETRDRLMVTVVRFVASALDASDVTHLRPSVSVLPTTPESDADGQAEAALMGDEVAGASEFED